MHAARSLVGRGRVLAVVVVLGLLASGCELSRASVSSTGVEGNLSSPIAVGVTDGGRYSTFTSVASNLVPGDTNGSADVFRHDADTGETIRVDLSASGAQLPDGMADAHMSKDGRFVVFTTLDQAAPGDTNFVDDVYLRDVVAGTTTLASVPPAEGFLPGSRAIKADVSDDGRYVAFTYGTDTARYLHRFDRQTAVTTRYIAGQFTDLQMSADANHFAFNTRCFDVTGCTPMPVLFDVPGSTPTWRTPEPGICAGDRVSAMSSDATWMIWFSADQSDPLGQCAERGYYLVLRELGASIPISLPTGAQVIGLSRPAHAVLYLAPGDALPGADPAQTHLYLFDRERVTQNREDFTISATVANASVTSAVLSDEGTSVVFVTEATNMVVDDHNASADVFVRQTGAREFAPGELGVSA